MPLPQAPLPRGWADLARTHRPAFEAMLLQDILPFWDRAADDRRGGVFSCWDNEGRALRSRDKFTWSQGRVAYLWSRVARYLERRDQPAAAAVWRGRADRAAAFLEHHVFLPDGRCAFVLSEDGRPLEPWPGAGLAPSIYADCFVALGLAEQARAAKDQRRLGIARELAERLARRIEAGDAPTHPDPVPPGYDAYAPAMILLNVRLVLAAAVAELAPQDAPAARAAALAGGERILRDFLTPAGRLHELRPRAAAEADTLLARHLNPGHALEGLWMLLEVGDQADRADVTGRAAAGVAAAWTAGWDEECGGLLHYVDQDGGPLRGRRTGAPLEERLLGSADTKLWWVHSEALYATLLAHRRTGDDALARAFTRTWEYVTRTFPHPDPAVGEWIQIRDRGGRPLNQVVALPVKDPYHIGRNLLQVLDLFDPPS